MSISLKEQRNQIREARSLIQKYLKREDISDIQFGFKSIKGKSTSLLSIRFLVDRKKPESKLSGSDRIPKKVGRFPTDVIDHKIKKQGARRVDPHDQVSPLIGGIEIQSSFFDQRSNWGTLGCVLDVNGVPHGFTNYHVVLSNLTEPQAEGYIGRLRVYQPNQPNGGMIIGRLTRLFDRELDYCAFVVEAPVDERQSLNNRSGIIRQSAYPVAGMRVGKTGAATGFTIGKIDALSLINPSRLIIKYEPGPENESDVISSVGDSGSVWVAGVGDQMKPVGLHYGGDTVQNVAYANSFTSIVKSIRSKYPKQ